MEQASRAFQALDGEIAAARFDPSDPSSVEVALNEVEQAIDRKIAPFSDSATVRKVAAELKSRYRQQILDRAAELCLQRETEEVAGPNVDRGILRQIENTVSDLRRVEYNTFSRHIKKLARLLHSPEVESLTRELMEGIDLKAWLAAGLASQRSMVGSARLEWPSDPKEELGTVVLLIDRFAENPDEAFQFVHTFYYPGNGSISATLQNMVGQMIVPFARDYIDHVKAKTGIAKTATAAQTAQPPSAEHRQADVFTLRPGLWGMNVDLKEAWQRCRLWWQRRQRLRS